MFEDVRRRQAARRVRPGTGRSLQRFRWWQQLSRALFSLTLSGADGRRIEYAVDVRPWRSDDDGSVLADLYRVGRHHASSEVPAAFPVEGGVIEVATSTFGLKRCHYVSADGAEQQLVPDPRSAAGRRARLADDHPALSRFIGDVSLVLLVVSLGVVVLELVDVIGRIPLVVDRVGSFASPAQLPSWLTISVGVGAVVAGVERALRLQYHWLLDGAAD